MVLKIFFSLYPIPLTCQFFSIGEIFYNIISEDYYDIFVSFYSYYFLWRIQQTPTNLDLQNFAAFI